MAKKTLTKDNPNFKGGSEPDNIKGSQIDDSIFGGIGADSLWGDSGDDSIDGGNENDLIWGGGDNDELLGGNGDDSITGDDGDDVLNGGTGNDTLNGSAGSDTMTGGDGDDTYYVDNIGDVIIESTNAKGGKDTVIITNPSLKIDDFNKFVGIENFSRINNDDSDIAGDNSANKLEGNVGNNNLIGNGGNDTLYGYDGDDTLEGGPGIDKLYGGNGDDTYIVSNEEDEIIDDKGTSTILSSETITLKKYINVKNLTLIGEKTINGTGNQSDNIIEGNDKDNKLDGHSGDDTLIGNDGDDTLIGSLGNDYLDGGNGENDVASYQGEFKDYKIDKIDGVFSVLNISNGARDELKDIEFVDIDGKIVQLDQMDFTPGANFPKISIQDVTISEGNKEGFTKAKMVIALNRPSSEEITVEVSTEDGTAVEGEDYESMNAETITFPAGITKKTVNINIVSDLITEEDENFFIKLDNPQNAEVSQGEAIVTITNDDKPMLSIESEIKIVEGTKGKANAEIIVSLGSPLSETVTVDYKTTDGSAKGFGSSSDFADTKGTLTFKAGDTTQKILVPIIDDKLTEKDEFFNVSLSNAKGALLDTTAAKAKVTIVDNDTVATKPVLSVSTPDFVGDGEDMQAEFLVKLSAPSSKIVTVKYATADGTAKNGSDYEKTSGILTFEAGETEQSVFVPIIGDFDEEPNEVFSLKLSGAKEATLGKESAAKATIIDGEVLVGDANALMIIGVNPDNTIM